MISTEIVLTAKVDLTGTTQQESVDVSSHNSERQTRIWLSELIGAETAERPRNIPNVGSGRGSVSFGSEWSEGMKTLFLANI